MKRVHFFIFLCITTCCLRAQAWKPAGNRMITQWGESLDPSEVWQEYPRPQMERKEWKNLNGIWEYAILAKSDPQPVDFQGDILVPFCVESALSGVGKSLMPDERLWYRTTFDLPGGWKGKRILLHFEAVDWSASVWINNAWAGSHTGGYDRFTLDITPYLQDGGKNELVVLVDDPSSMGEQPRGKQVLNPRGIWYTPVSGIWQTVWLEPVTAEGAIGEIRITPDVDSEIVSLAVHGDIPLAEDLKVVAIIKKEGTVVVQKQFPLETETAIPLVSPRLWSPEDPFLYDLELVLRNNRDEAVDRVSSYFGMRKVSLGEYRGHTRLFLNNRTLFHYGTLDQGWWPDGLHTPPSDEAMRFDLEVTKKMGFNMIRKHIKVEPQRWYYHCDRLGIMVWQDMPSVMVELPGKGDQRNITRLFVGRSQPDPPRRTGPTARFEWELRRMIDLHYNAPSIVMWVPFNEGWGQYATCRITAMIQSLDPTRMVNPVSGWSLRPCGDVYDIHSYDTVVTVPPVALDRASVVGEYGGIGLPVTGHLWDPEMRNWGYQTYQSTKELITHYKKKFNQISRMKETMGLSGAVYTQTTDVEGEVNGLMTYDRKVIKIPADTLFRIHQVLYESEQTGR